MTVPARRLLLLALAGQALNATAHAGAQFGPLRLKSGESVRLVAHTETNGGTIETSRQGKFSTGTMRVVRDREIVWTLREPAADGTVRVMARIPRFRSVSVINLQGQEDNRTDESRLVGKLISAQRDKQGAWKFELDGSVIGNRDKAELEELAAYQNRQWFPNREVNVGDSWEFDPAWIKLVIERDLAKAQTVGTMKLAQIRRTLFKQTAVIDVSIRSTGKEWRADGRETGAAVDLAGKMTVDLDTMLDEQLELEGTFNSVSRKGIESTKVNLPLRLEVKKSVVKGGAAQ